MPTNDEVLANTILSITGMDVSGTLLSSIMFFCIFMFFLAIFTKFTKMKTGVCVLSAYSIIFALDMIDSYGEYTFNFPFGNDWTITHGVLTAHMLDWIYMFGIFDYASEILAVYSAEAVLSTSPYVIYGSALYAFGDMILAFVFITLGINAAITLLENKSHKQCPYQKIISITISALIIWVWMQSFSNPVHEMETTQNYFATAMYFILEGSNIEHAVVLILGVLGFGILYIANVIFMDVGVTGIANMSSKNVETFTSFKSVTIALTVMYSFMFMLHPDYAWYYIVMMISVMKFFRLFLDKIVKRAGIENMERRRDMAISAQTLHDLEQRGAIPPLNQTIERTHYKKISWKYSKGDSTILAFCVFTAVMSFYFLMTA